MTGVPRTESEAVEAAPSLSESVVSGSPPRGLRWLAHRTIGPKLGVLRQYSPRKLRVHRYPKLNVGSTPLPTISIVTPSLDQGRFLSECLSSILDQDYSPFEYFVQDGGSTDESESILRKFDSRLSGWEVTPDRGQAHAINIAFGRTSGQIMSWLNSDDLLMPGALRYVAQFFARHPEVSVLYGNRILIDTRGFEIGRWILPEHQEDILPWIDYIPQETLFWRRSAWEAIGGKLDESLHFAMDWDLLLRFQQARLKFARTPYFLGAFRVHPQQKTSSQMNSSGVQEIAALRKRYLGYLPSEAEISEQVKWYLYRHLLEHARVQIKHRVGI